jgi:hypothetical protein
MLIAWLIILLALALLLYGSVRVFRHGARQRFITSMPVGKLLFWSVGFQLFVALLDWLTADDDALPLLYRLKLGAFVFAAGAAMWFVGLFYGRWREARRVGVLKSK